MLTFTAVTSPFGNFVGGDLAAYEILYINLASIYCVESMIESGSSSIGLSINQYI